MRSGIWVFNDPEQFVIHLLNYRLVLECGWLFGLLGPVLIKIQDVTSPAFQGI